jgi:hypothetical protein
LPKISLDLHPPHEAQLVVLRSRKRFNVVACGRRWGKTDMGENLALKPALDGHAVAWFAPTYKLLEEAWDRFTTTFRGQAEANKSERVIRIPATGGRIDFWTLSGGGRDQSIAGRGRAYKRVVVDEAAMAARLERDWTEAIRPTLTDQRGDAWFLSTPRGQNYFYRLFSRGQSAEPGWSSWSMPTERNPFISRAEIEDARRDLPADAFEQEYLAAFLANAANPFGIDAIRAATMEEIAHGPVVCWGADLAKSHDWTVAIGLNAAGEVCAFQRWQSDWRNTQARLRAMLDDAPSFVDSTGVGDPIVEGLQAGNNLVEGYHFTRQSKQQLMEGLAAAIHQKRVRYPSGLIVSELESFQYQYAASGVTYSAPDGLHDDCVCALALAVRRMATMPPGVRGYLVGTAADPVDRFASGYDPILDDRLWTIRGYDDV